MLNTKLSVSGSNMNHMFVPSMVKIGDMRYTRQKYYLEKNKRIPKRSTCTAGLVTRYLNHSVRTSYSNSDS